MKKYIIILLLTPSLAFAITANQIIKMVDKNENFSTQKFSATMTIQKGKRKLVKKFNGYGQKNGEKSFMTFTNPEDRGVKYLKKTKELWIYFPDADDIMKISGHMLRQGMMGSDISYEDMLESGDFEKKYQSKLLKDKVIDGNTCYVIELNAKIKSATYAQQILFINKQKFTAVKVEMYAKGGRLLKKMSLSNFKNISGKHIPMKIVIQDMRKRNSKTTISFNSILLNVNLPGGIFTRRSLRR